MDVVVGFFDVVFDALYSDGNLSPKSVSTFSGQGKQSAQCVFVIVCRLRHVCKYGLTILSQPGYGFFLALRPKEEGH